MSDSNSISNKRLATVLAADIAGYSRLMSENEERTLSLLGRFRKIMDGGIAHYEGRIANTAGDSVIAVFPSASQAFKCAVAVQKRLKVANAEFADSEKVQFRIGLHVGEIYSKGKDVLGDGVNIAARLESQAEPGGVCFSYAVHGLVEKILKDIDLADLGPLELKNIKNKVHAYEVMSTRAEKAAATKKKSVVLTKKQRKLMTYGAAILVVITAIGFAFTLSRNVLGIVEMAQKNPVYRIQKEQGQDLPQNNPDAPNKTEFESMDAGPVGGSSSGNSILGYDQ